MGHDITFLIGGAAGQGIQPIGSLLDDVCHKSGLFVFSYNDFQSRIRGRQLFHLLRISNQPLVATSLFSDSLVVMAKNSCDLHHNSLTDRGRIPLNQAKSETSDDAKTVTNNDTQTRNRTAFENILYCLW